MIVAPFIEEWGRHPYSVLYVFTYGSLDRAMRATALRSRRSSPAPSS